MGALITQMTSSKLNMLGRATTNMYAKSELSTPLVIHTANVLGRVTFVTSLTAEFTSVTREHNVLL